MKRKIAIVLNGKKVEVLDYMIAIILTFFSTAGYLKYYIIPNEIVRGMLVLGLFCILLIFTVLERKYSIIHTLYIAFMSIIFIRNNYYAVNGNWILFFCFLSAIILIMYSKISIAWVDKYLKALLWVYSLYAFCTILFYFTPEFYLKYVVNLFPDTRIRLIEWYKQGYMAGFTEHYSTNGMFMSAGFLLSIASLLKKNNKKREIFQVLFFGIALLLTGKRAHTFFSIIAVYVMYYLYNYHKKNRFLKMAGVVLAGMCIFLIISTMLPNLYNAFIRMSFLISGKEDATAGRGILWELALRYFHNHPVFGIGWGQFRQYTVGIWRVSESANVHNSYIQLLCETGIIGFIIYMCWFLYNVLLAIRSFKSAVQKKLDNDNIYLLGFAICFETFFLFYCITGNPLYDMEMFIPYFVSCSIVYSYSIRYDIRLLKKDNR